MTGASAAICVDASVALLWLIPDTQTPAARRLRRYCNREGVRMLAPPLFRAEVTSVIRRWVFTGGVSESYGREALQRALKFPVMISDDSVALQQQAYDLATSLNRPRAYDTQYLALAEMRRCPLWTADQRFVNAVGGRFPNVRWLGEFQG